MRDDNNGNKEGKQTLNIREEAVNYISNKEARILELGPLTRPLLERKDYPNYFFADIRSTEEIRELYSGSKYLEETGISVEIDKIVDIDFVIKGSYKESFKGVEKFDYVIVSHVLEHIPNLLQFFVDIRDLMTESASLIIIYPDKRFSFDYFRTNTKFSDVYDTYINDGKRLASQALDFYTNVIPENDPVKFWNFSEAVELYQEEDLRPEENIEIYKDMLKGAEEEDIHYWPFSDFAFIKFLQECSIYKLFSFSLSKFIPTQKNTQSFLVILSFGKGSDKEDFEGALSRARSYFVNEFYKVRIYREDILSLVSRNDRLTKEVGELGEETAGFKKHISNLEMERQKLQSRNSELELIVKSLHIELEDRSRIRYMAKCIIVKLFRKTKEFLCSVPSKILYKFKESCKN